VDCGQDEVMSSRSKIVAMTVESTDGMMFAAHNF